MIKYLLGIALFFISCSSTTVNTPTFSADDAFRYIEEQVAFGPRVPGTEASAQARDYFYKHFKNRGFEIDSMTFVYDDAYSDNQIPMVNVIARFNGDPSGTDRILVCAHYDSRPRTDHAHDKTKMNDPIDGANDGGSGVAVLMALADLFKIQSPGINVDFVLFDGEDWGKSGDPSNYLIGSRAFAKTGIRDKYKFGILLDMIADHDQKILREIYSEMYAKKINDMLFSTAKNLGITTLIDSVGPAVLDDHIPLNAAGVPTANLIDMDYPYWHTEFDTPENCSVEALDRIGKLMTTVLYNKKLWPNL